MAAPGDPYYMSGRLAKPVGASVPTLAGAYCMRALAYAQKKDLDKAVADYSEAIRLDPNLANAFCGRGLTYAVKGDLDAARADYTEAIRIDPNCADAYCNRGRAVPDERRPRKRHRRLHRGYATGPEKRCGLSLSGRCLRGERAPPALTTTRQLQISRRPSASTQKTLTPIAAGARCMLKRAAVATRATARACWKNHGAIADKRKDLGASRRDLKGRGESADTVGP